MDKFFFEHHQNLTQEVYTVFFKLVVQGLREIGVSYCIHKMTSGKCLH